MDLDDILGGAWIKNFIECTQMLGNTIVYRCPLQNANVRSALLFLRQSFVILVITWQVGRQYLHLLVVFCSTGTCISNAQLQQFLESSHISGEQPGKGRRPLSLFSLLLMTSAQCHSGFWLLCAAAVEKGFSTGITALSRSRLENKTIREHKWS